MKRGKNKTNIYAVLSFVFAFFVPLAAIVLAIIALYQIKTTGEKGKYLSIWAIIISVILSALSIYLGISNLNFA